MSKKKKEERGEKKTMIRGSVKCQPGAGGVDGGDCHDGCGRWSATSGGDDGEGGGSRWY